MLVYRQSQGEKHTQKRKENKTMKQYTFNTTDKGKIGKAFEMAFKEALGLKNADTVSPQGQPDFRYNRICYDVKQNGTVVQYSDSKKYIKGSSRVIYATHVAYTEVKLDDDTVGITVDLKNTDMVCLDRNEFVEFLKATKGFLKKNNKRNEVNIQSMYNYSKQELHGKKAAIFEAWASEHWLDDEVMDIIFDRA